MFVIPFITCLGTIIGIKYFVDHRLTGVYGEIEAKQLFIFISIILFINVLASFVSLVSYWCLENKVDSILRKERKKHHGKKD